MNIVMFHKPIISVIIPIYNVAEYLDKCIKSVLSQTYIDFELLLIDDGSTDESADICKNACEQDDRIRYFYKENGGLSDARNFGLKHIRGEYVSFIDSDDWVESTYLEYLFNAIKINDSDMSTCIYMLRQDGKAIPWKTLPSEPRVLSGREALISLLSADAINVSSNGKLLRSSLFEDICFPCGKHFEDVGTTYKLIQKSKTVAVGGAPLYNYFMRSNSITHSSNSRIFDRFELAKYAYLDLQSDDWEINDSAEYYYINHSLSVLHSCNLKDKAQKEKAIRIKKEILQHKSNILLSGYASRRDKIALYILSLGLPIYQLSWFFYSVIKR